MKRTIALPLLACAALLGGCEQIQQAIDYITPDDASLNGYVVQRDAAGNPTGAVDMNVSALDTNGEPIDGEITSASATVDNAITAPNTVVAAQQYVAEAEVTVNIEVEEIVNAVLDIDQSGSMNDTDPERQRVEAAKSFIERIKPEDRLAVMTFQGADEGFRASSLLQDFTSDKAALGAAVDKVKQTGYTPIWASVLDTVDLHGSDEGGGNASRVVVLFTDGKSQRDRATFAEALSGAKASGAKYFTVGLGAGNEDLDMSALQQLAEETGGTFANVDNPDELDELFNKIFNAIRASGVITLRISPVPPAGTIIQGTLTFEVNDQTFDLPYAIQF